MNENVLYYAMMAPGRADPGIEKWAVLASENQEECRHFSSKEGDSGPDF